MKTDDLVAMLANGVQPVDRSEALRRAIALLAAGAIGSALLTLALFGPNPRLGQDALAPTFWVREAFCAASAIAGLFAVLRFCRPGAPTARMPALLAAPVAMLWGLAVVALFAASGAERVSLVLGSSWRECSLSIVAVSVPAFVAVFWLMRGLAPTRLRMAGAAAGFAAGSLGAAAYTLHCPELAVPFVAVWYVLGILLCIGFGAVAGPRLLRW